MSWQTRRDPYENLRKEVTPNLNSVSLTWDIWTASHLTPLPYLHYLAPALVPAALAGFLALPRTYTCSSSGCLDLFLLPKKPVPQTLFILLPHSFSFCPVVTISFKVMVFPIPLYLKFQPLDPSAILIPQSTLCFSMVLTTIYIQHVSYTSLWSVILN